MSSLETLTEQDLIEEIEPDALRKAYGLMSAVSDTRRQGFILYGNVLDGVPYPVAVDVMDGFIEGACHCIYEDGLCKHIGALLLKWVRMPETFEGWAGLGSRASAVGDYTPGSDAALLRLAVGPTWLHETLASRQQASLDNLARWLEESRLEDLRTLAREHGWTIKGTRKADVADQIATQMASPTEINKALSKLDVEHRHMLRALALVGGLPGMRLTDAERIAKGWGNFKRHKQVDTYIQHLAQRGLVIYQDNNSYSEVRLSFIPLALQRQLPPLLADIVPHQVAFPVAGSSASLRLANPTVFMRGALQMLTLLEQTPTALRPPPPRPPQEKNYAFLKGWDFDLDEIKAADQSGKLRRQTGLTFTIPPPAPPLPDATMAQLRPLVGDEARQEFTFWLLAAAGLFQPGDHITVSSTIKEAFFKLDEPQQRAVLARTYFNLVLWNELWPLLRANPDLRLVRNIFGYSYGPATREALYAELSLFRRLVLQTLIWLPDDEWVALKDVFETLRHVWPRFNQTVWYPYYGGQNQGNWHMAYRGEPLRLDNTQDWLQAQGRFVMQMLSGPLHWLGLVDLHTANGEVTDIRLHGLADLFLDRTDAAPIPQAATVETGKSVPPRTKIEVDGDVIQVDPATTSVQGHNLLERIAKLESAQPHRFVYRLDPLVVHRTFEQGVALSELTEGWKRDLTPKLPDTVADRLATWWEAYGRVRLYQDATLIEFGDDYALAEMKAITSLDKVMIAEISPRLVLIPKEAADTLSAELIKAGYTPQQANHAG